MRRLLRITIVVGVLAALAGASLALAAKPTTVQQGWPWAVVNGDFFPKKISKEERTPIGLKLSVQVRSRDGSHPPALSGFNVEIDRNVYVDTRGYPVCQSGFRLRHRTPDEGLKRCRKALVGRGRSGVEVEFIDQPPIEVQSELLVFNGGTKEGKTTLYVHAFFDAPITGAIVTTVKIKRTRDGRYGTHMAFAIPKIANGSGSVRRFDLTIDRKFTVRGKRRSVITARCLDGKLVARADARFYDDPAEVKSEIPRTCQAK